MKLTGFRVASVTHNAVVFLRPWNDLRHLRNRRLIHLRILRVAYSYCCHLSAHAWLQELRQNKLPKVNQVLGCCVVQQLNVFLVV